MESFITIASFLFFTGLVGLLTWWITRGEETHSTAGYFLAGRSLTFPLIAGSLLLTNLSTEQMVGLNGDAYTNGLSVMVWEVGSVIAMVFMAWFFLPRFLKSGVATVPEYLQLRFDHQTSAITNVIFLLAYVAILLPMILFTGAEGMTGILDVPTLLFGDAEGLSPDELLRRETMTRWIIVIAVGVVGSTYALTGGLRTVAVSDTLNGVGLLVGGFLITFFALSQLGGDGGWTAGWERIRTEQQTRFNSVGSTESLVPFGEVFSGIFLLMLFYWSTNQQIIQRTFGASSLAEGQKGVLLTGALKLLGPIYLVLPGMIAYSMFAGDVTFEPQSFVAQSDSSQFELTVQATRGDESKRLTVPVEISQEAFLSKKMAVHQAGSFQDADETDPTKKDFDYDKLGMLKPAQAYGKLVNAVLPTWLTGFFAAVMLGAILSSFNSALNSSCTLFSLGMYKEFFAPNASERAVVASSKIFGIIVAAAAMIIAPGLAKYSSIFDYLQKMNGIYFIPILSVVLVGMLTRRVPAVAAKLGLLVGFVVMILGNFVPPFSTIAGSMGAGFFFLGTVFCWLVMMMLVVGEIWPREQEWEQQDVQAVDMTPWKLSGAAGIALIVAVISIYGWFADFGGGGNAPPTDDSAANVEVVESAARSEEIAR